MRRKKIDSTAIKTAGFDAQEKVLEIEFYNKAAVWQYLQFPETMFRSFMKASSKGNFFVTQIKGNYPERKVR